MYFYIFLAINNECITVNAYSTHWIDFGHIGNISGAPPPIQYKVSSWHICHKALSFTRVGLVQGGHKHFIE